MTDSDAAEKTPGFGERGRMRRRARFLRKARELAYRDLGGLVFDLHRFGKRNDPVVMAKLATLGQIHTELGALERALRERQSVTVLREVGIAACPRCAAIHGGDDRFCPGCGLAFDAKAERPLSPSPVTQGPLARPPAAQTSQAQGATPAITPLPAPGSPLTAQSASAPVSPPAPAPPVSPVSPAAPASPATPASPASSASPAIPAAPSPGSQPQQTPAQGTSGPAQGTSGPAPAPSEPKPPPQSQTPPVRAPAAQAPASTHDGIEEEQPTRILRPPGKSA